mgnify:CR=1 FL=1
MIDFLINAAFFICGGIVALIFLLSRPWIFIPFTTEEAPEEEVLEFVQDFAFGCNVDVKLKDMRIIYDGLGS